MALTILIGGARAGKSALASRLARETGLPVTFIATAEPGDEEMQARIARHRAERPAAWTTLEEPVHLDRALGVADPDRALIVDCLTLWISNLILRGHDNEEIEERTMTAAIRAAGRAAPTFVVTNEVGSGVHPSSELGRRFRDLLGRANSIWSAQAAHAYLVIAGRTVVLDEVGKP